FFFSSRRRHTRSYGDWSSDVCSSDLQPAPAAASPAGTASGPTASVASPGGKVKFAVGGDPLTLDPHASNARGDRLFYYELFDPLVTLDESLNIQPGLAEKWEVAPDGLAYTFTLRPGIKFHDGTELTPEIAKWNFDRMLD